MELGKDTSPKRDRIGRANHNGWVLCLGINEAKFKNDEFKKEVRQAARRGEAHIKNLVSMGVYVIGVLALLSAFFYPTRTAPRTACCC